MPMGACCSPSAPRANRWRACGNFRAARSRPGERPEETLIREMKEELGIVVREPCLAPLTFASHAYPDFHLLMPLYVCRRWEGIVHGPGGATARLGAAEPAPGLQDAAGRRTADRAPDDAAVNEGNPDEVETLGHAANSRASRRPERRDRDRICDDRGRRRRRRRRTVSAWARPTTSTTSSRGCSEHQPPAFSPAEISLSQRVGEPRLGRARRSGFCWLSCGAQPDSQTISNVARMRPSGSAKRSA